MMRIISFFTILSFTFTITSLYGQHSVARQWNEMALTSIRKDYARPTVHARNLFHISAAMYDSWAVYDSIADTHFLGKTHKDFEIVFDGIETPEDVKAAQEETMSYAVYNLMRSRFRYSPNALELFPLYDSMMISLGYDPNFTSIDYSNGSSAALGNYLGLSIIQFGKIDGSREDVDYQSRRYWHSNEPLVIVEPGNPNMTNPNKWQPLSLGIVIDQSGNERPAGVVFFLNPEWGEVYPFALSEEDLIIYETNDYDFWVYHDPGAPPLLNTQMATPESEFYKWAFCLVSAWSSHLDPSDGVMIDISPASVGNIGELPSTVEEYKEFYDLEEGTFPDQGWEVNPVTGNAYEPNIVPRGDFARVLAEFWADGPDSETPPGHWFTILNYVNDHPLSTRKFEGKGEDLDELEWDVKAYLMMGGAMHDAAVTAWGVKGFYDYPRPVSILRYLADKGQSTTADKSNYDPILGMPLIDGFIEEVLEEDELAGPDKENVGKIKLYAWRGPDNIEEPDSTVAGVGWILAENWYPYQRPSFVTPPFAGYVSGHSTYSRAAAELLTKLTGDDYFPGGIGEFEAKKNEFLVFEDGPSQDITLQWATYRDAAGQSGLSRIWGGIHPPVDDIPGRIMGERIGKDAYNYAAKLFDTEYISDTEELDGDVSKGKVFPNPISNQDYVTLKLNDPVHQVQWAVLNIQGQLVTKGSFKSASSKAVHNLELGAIEDGVYILKLMGDNLDASQKIIVQRK